MKYLSALLIWKPSPVVVCCFLTSQHTWFVAMYSYNLIAINPSYWYWSEVNLATLNNKPANCVNGGQFASGRVPIGPPFAIAKAFTSWPWAMFFMWKMEVKSDGSLFFRRSNSQASALYTWIICVLLYIYLYIHCYVLRCMVNCSQMFLVYLENSRMIPEDRYIPYTQNMYKTTLEPWFPGSQEASLCKSKRKPFISGTILENPPVFLKSSSGSHRFTTVTTVQDFTSFFFYGCKWMQMGSNISEAVQSSLTFFIQLQTWILPGRSFLSLCCHDGSMVHGC